MKETCFIFRLRLLEGNLLASNNISQALLGYSSPLTLVKNNI